MPFCTKLLFSLNLPYFLLLNLATLVMIVRICHQCDIYYYDEFPWTGLVIDADLSMTSHVDNIIRICYSHIRQLRAIRRSLTTESTQAFVRAFVHSRLDYCNGALAGLPGYTYKRLRAVLRSAARLCLRLPSFASVSDAMRRDLHWLNFPNRVTYKLGTIAVFVYVIWNQNRCVRSMLWLYTLRVKK